MKKVGDDEKEAATAAAKAAAKQADDATKSVPEQHKAYGVKVRGAALGDRDFEAA